MRHISEDSTVSTTCTEVESQTPRCVLDSIHASILGQRNRGSEGSSYFIISYYAVFYGFSCYIKSKNGDEQKEQSRIMNYLVNALDRAGQGSNWTPVQRPQSLSVVSMYNRALLSVFRIPTTMSVTGVHLDSLNDHKVEMKMAPVKPVSKSPLLHYG